MNWKPDPAAEQRHRAQVGPHERAGAQDPEAHQRRTPRAARSPRTRPAGRRRRRTTARVRAEAHPASGASHHGEHQQQHRRGDAHGAGQVEPAPGAGRARPVVGTSLMAATSVIRATGRGQEEHPAPADLGEQAADDQAEREADGPGGGVDGERPVAGRPLGEARGDDREARRRREGRADALDEAGGDEQGAVVGQAAQAGGDERRRRGRSGTCAAGRAGRRRGRRAAGSRRSRARRR